MMMNFTKVSLLFGILLSIFNGWNKMKTEKFGIIVASMALFLIISLGDVRGSVVVSGPLDIKLGRTLGDFETYSFNFDGAAANNVVFNVQPPSGVAGSSWIEVSGAQFVTSGGNVARMDFGALISSTLNPGFSWGAGGGTLHGGILFGGNLTLSGSFAPDAFGYLGLRFQNTNFQTVYGWIEYRALSTDSSQTRGQITGWGYQSDVGNGVTFAGVPEPSALLLVGSLVGLIAARRRR